MVNGENPHVGLRLLRRHDREAARGAAGRAPQVLHGVRDPPHDDALGALARGGAARAAGRGARLAARRRRRDLRRPRAPARRARQGASRRSGSTCTTRRTGWASRRTARCSTATSRPTRSGSSTCSACATSRTRPAASSRSSRSRSIPQNTVFERRGFKFQTGADDLKMIAVSRLLLDNIPTREGLLDLADDAGRPGRAALRRERRAGHGRARGDLPRRRRDDRAPSRRSTSSCASSGPRAASRCSATRSTTSCTGGERRRCARGLVATGTVGESHASAHIVVDASHFRS